MGEKVKVSRNAGIDMLRLVSMLFIVVLHMTGYGGVTNGMSRGQVILSSLLYSITYCAVDIYALISGYVGCSSHKKPYEGDFRLHFKKFMTFWIPVAFYSCGISFLAYLIWGKEVGRRQIAAALFPVTTAMYWYVCAYVGVILLLPLLNGYIRRCSDRELRHTAVLLLAAFCLYSSLAKLWSDPFVLNSGYSMLWLATLYVIGAWLKRETFFQSWRIRHLILIILFCVLITWANDSLLPAGVQAVFPRVQGMLLTYLSPTVVCMSCAYVLLFARLSLAAPAVRWIEYLAPAAFGVYLIHVHPIVWHRLFIGGFTWVAGYHSVGWIVLVLGVSAVIFIGCLILERVRISIFRTVRVFLKKVIQK